MPILATRSFTTEEGIGNLTLKSETFNDLENKIASQILEQEHARIFDLQVMFGCDVKVLEKTLAKLGSVVVEINLHDIEARIPVLSHIKVLDGVIFYEYCEEFLILFKGKSHNLKHARSLTPPF